MEECLINEGCRVFIQARMSSLRFPGKVLAPFNGIPIIRCVIEQVLHVVTKKQLVILTSQEESDNPLYYYLKSLGVATFRGELDDVFNRFKKCIQRYPCEWFVRICADSPLLDYKILQSMIVLTDGYESDLITNVFPRTFPKGQSIEIVRSETFESINEESLSPLQKEHITQVYYDRPDQYKIVNFENEDKNRQKLNYSIDTIDDLRKLQDLVV